jgi:hypothetical protein
MFTDIEGSTRPLSELGPDRYRTALEDHWRILRSASRDTRDTRSKRVEYNRSREQLRNAIDPAVLAGEWTAGRLMSMEEAITFAVEATS